MSEERTLHWNPALEALIAGEGERCRGQAWIHSKAEHQQAWLDSLVAIPVIVLSTLAGAASVGSGAILPSGQHTSTAIGVVSISVGILNTLASRFGWAKRSEGHRVAFLSQSKMFAFLAVEMALPREERMTPQDLLKMVRESQERLAQTSPSLPPFLLELFRKEFQAQEDVAKPAETNGLAKITVFQTAEPKPPEPPERVRVTLV